MWTLLSSQLFILVPMFQWKYKFPINRFISCMLIWMTCTIYHMNPICYSLQWYLDQIVMWICGPYVLSYDYSFLVTLMTLMSGFNYFVVFKRNTNNLQHSIGVHFPIALAMFLQRN